MLQRYGLGLLIVGAICASAVHGAIATAEQTSRKDPDRSLQVAEVDLCYVGSTVDPDTGKTIDLYDVCTQDVIGGNLDLA